MLMKTIKVQNHCYSQLLSIKESYKVVFYSICLCLFLSLSCFTLLAVEAPANTKQTPAVLEKTAAGGKVRIQFVKGNWYEILKKAKSENKLVFVEVYATYNEDSKALQKEAFNNPTLAAYYNVQFVNYQIDIVHDKKATTFAELYDLNFEKLPALLFFNPQAGTKGELLHSQYGPTDITTLLKTGQDLLESNKPVVQLANYQLEDEQFIASENEYLSRKTGERSLENLQVYAYGLKQQRRPYNEVVNEYLQTLTKQQHQTTSEEWKVHHQFIYDFAINVENEAIEVFIHNFADFRENYGEQPMQDKLKAAISNSVFTAIYQNNQALFKRTQQILTLIKVLAILPTPVIEEFDFEMQSLFYQGIGNWHVYSQIAYEYLHQRPITNAVLLNKVAHNFQQNVSSKTLLQSALGWINKSIKIEDAYYNNHTKALLLYNLEKPKKAEKAAQRAIDIATLQGGIDYRPSLELLEQIR